MGVYVSFCGRLLATSVVLMMFIQIFLCWWIGSWFKTRSPNLLIDDCKECKDFSGIGCHEAYEFMLLPFVVVFIYQNMEDAWMSLNESPLRCRWKFELVWQTHIIFLYFLWQFLHPPIPMWRHGCHKVDWLHLCVVSWGGLWWIPPNSWISSLSLCLQGWSIMCQVKSPACVVLQSNHSLHHSYLWSWSPYQSKQWCDIPLIGMSPGWFPQGVELDWNGSVALELHPPVHSGSTIGHSWKNMLDIQNSMILFGRVPKY